MPADVTTLRPAARTARTTCTGHPDCRRAPAAGGLCADHTPPPDIPGPFTGITYRQLDYWVRIGHLRPDDAAPGSGTARTFHPKEAVVAHLIARLLNAGLTLPAAARAARHIADHPDQPHVPLRGGITLDLDPT